MIPARFALPEGRRGQALALAVTLAGAALLWSVTVAPLLGWYDARQDELDALRARAAHMQALGAEIPALRAAVARAGLHSSDAGLLLPGDTDVIAGANLQTTLQTLAAQAGTTLVSAALQPAQAAGALRRISIQVSVTARWPVLIALLKAITSAEPRMIVDTLTLTLPGGGTGQPQQVQAGFTVTAFRAGPP